MNRNSLNREYLSFAPAPSARTRMAQVALAALLGALMLAGCRREEPAPVTTTPPPATEPAPEPMMPEPMPMPAGATSVVAVDLGNKVGTDMKVATPATTFMPKDTVYASISTKTSDPAASVPGKLGVKWTHVDSNQVVHEESRDVTFSGDGVTEFHVSKPDGWPAGKYKVEVSLDGAVVQTREFEVKQG